MLSIMINEVQFVVKVTNVTKEDRKFVITLVEPTKDEQIAWLRKNTSLQKPVHLIIVTSTLLKEGSEERWANVKELLKKRFNVEPKIVATSKKELTDDETKKIANSVIDVFVKPIDTIYFLQKLKTFFPFIREKSDRIAIRSVDHKETVKAVYPVRVSEISEAGFVMTHSYNMPVGSFREVVLWQPYQIGSPELLCTCNYVEALENEKGMYKCQFVFFGISDFFLKNIRIWIRNTYVHSKEGQAAS
jgi:hypothetical protein